jgi:hypothetical protein
LSTEFGLGSRGDAMTCNDCAMIRTNMHVGTRHLCAKSGEEVTPRQAACATPTPRHKPPVERTCATCARPGCDWGKVGACAWWEAQ